MEIPSTLSYSEHVLLVIHSEMTIDCSKLPDLGPEVEFSTVCMVFKGNALVYSLVNTELKPLESQCYYK